MTKATEGQKKLLILLLAIVMVAGVWRFVYTPLMEKSDQMETEIQTLQEQVDSLKSLSEQKEMFIQRTAAYGVETEAIVNKYGPGNTPEKIIMFLVDLSKKTNMTIPSVSFGQETNVTVLADGTELSEAGMTTQSSDSAADGDAAEGSDESAAGGTEDASGGKASDYYLYNYPVTFSITVSYSGLKEALTYIQEYSERAVVDNISLGYDSATGRLTGSITLNMYTMTGTAKPYLAPQIDGISLGVANIFGSVQ